MILNELKEKIINFSQKNKTIVLFVSILLICMTLIGTVLIFVQSFSKQKKIPNVEQQKLEIKEEILVPQSSVILNEYTQTREQKENWTEEEAKEWFTTPTQKEVDNLSLSNDKIIQEILGATP